MKLSYKDGNSRSEISMAVPQLPGGALSLVSLVLKDSPGQVFMLDEKNKSYTVIDATSDEDWKDAPESDYVVTVIGNENVNGYNCTHASVTRKGEKTAEEYWTTTEINDFASLMGMKAKYIGKDNLTKALAAKGANGFPVRIKTIEQGNAITVDMVKVEVKSHPATLFSLDGYKKSAGATIIPGGIDIQQIMNMTPEEREKMMKEMEEMYKQD